MTGTDMSTVSEYIHCWDSKDLITFTNEHLIHVNTTGMHSWAPEAFYDKNKGQYAIIWSGATDHNRTYVNYTTDFINITAPEVYFNPGVDEYDAGSFNSGGYVSNIYSANVSEAPIIVKKIGADVWYLYGDSYSPVNGEFYCWQSNDISTNSWQLLSKGAYDSPLNCKHGTVTPITAKEQSNLITKWVNPNAYLRQLDYSIVLNENDDSSTFKGDATFYKASGGFADSTWTSFKSYSNPDRYIRHSNYVLRIDTITSSSSTADKQDGTFNIGS